MGKKLQSYTIAIDLDVTKLGKLVAQAKEDLQGLGDGINISGVDFSEMKEEFQEILSGMQSEIEKIKVDQIEFGKINTAPLDDLLNRFESINKQVELINKNWSKIDFVPGIADMAFAMDELKKSVDGIVESFQSIGLFQEQKISQKQADSYIDRYKNYFKIKKGVAYEPPSTLKELKPEANQIYARLELAQNSLEDIENKLSKAKTGTAEHTRLLEQQAKAYLEVYTESSKLEATLEKIYDKAATRSKNPIDEYDIEGMDKFFQINKVKKEGLSTYADIFADVVDKKEDILQKAIEKTELYTNILHKYGYNTKGGKNLNPEQKIIFPIAFELQEDSANIPETVKKILLESQAIADEKKIELDLQVKQDSQGQKDIESLAKKFEAERDIYRNIENIYEKLKGRTSKKAREVFGITPEAIKSMVDDVVAQATPAANVFDELNTALEQVVRTLKEISGLIRIAFDIPDTELDQKLNEQWESIKASFAKFTDKDGNINTRKKGAKKAIEEMLLSYANYEKMGGTHLMNEVTQNVATLKKLSDLYKKLDKSKIDNNGIDLLPSKEMKNKTVVVKQLQDSFTSLEEIIETVKTAFDGLKINLDLSDVTTKIDSNFKKMSKSVTGSIQNIITQIKLLDASLRVGLNLESRDVLDKQWEDIETQYKNILNKSGTIDSRKGSKFKQFVSSYQDYKNKGGEKSYESLTSNAGDLEKLKNKISNTRDNIYFDKFINEFSTETGELKTQFSQFTSKIDSLITQLTNTTQSIETFFNNIHGENSLALLKSISNEDFLKKEETIKQSLIEMLSKNNISDPYDLELVRKYNAKKDKNGKEYGEYSYSFSGKYTNKADEIVGFKGSLNSGGQLNNLDTKIISTKQLSAELKETASLQTKYKKIVNNFQKLKIEMEDIESSFDRNTKIPKFSTDFASAMDLYLESMKKVESYLDKDLSKITEEDLNSLETLFKSHKIDAAIVKNIAHSSAYEMANRSGVAEYTDVFDFEDALLKAELLAGKKGELLQSLSYSETEDLGYSTFTTKVKDQIGEIRQVSYAWNSELGTLRELSSVIGQTTEFGQFQKVADDFDKIDRSVVRAFNNLNELDISYKSDAFQRDAGQIIETIIQLMDEGAKLSEKNILDFGEGDLTQLEGINASLREQLKLLDDAVKSDKYDVTNNKGNLISDNIDYSEAIIKAEEYAKTKGKLVKSLEITEPVNGIAKFTANVKDAADEVGKLSFVWDGTTKTLRETTKISGTITPFGEFQKVRKDFTGLSSEITRAFDKINALDTSDKIEAYSKDIKDVTSNIQELANKGAILESRDISLFQDSDVQELTDINYQIKEQLQILDNILSNDNYDISNKQGKLVADNLKYTDAFDEVKKIASTNGQLLKDISFTEPVNDVAKFTAEIQTQSGEVQKLDFVWNKLGGTLRQVTRVSGSKTPFVEFQKELSTFSKKESEIVDATAIQHSGNKTEQYYKDIEPIKNELLNLLQLGRQLEQQDIDLFSESDISEIEQINRRTDELLAKLRAIDKNDSYDLFNKHGQIISPEVNYLKAIELAKKDVLSRGDVIKDLSYSTSAPVDGIAQMTASVRTQNNEVQKITYTWDSFNQVLRETTTVQGRNYTEIQNELNKISTLETKATEALDNENANNKIDAYEQEVDRLTTKLDTLFNEAKEFQSKGLNLVSESDLNNLKNINIQIEDTISALEKTLVNDKYNVSNKHGNLIKENIGFDEAKEFINEFTKDSGQLLKNIDFSEPANGLAKFTAQVATQEGAVKNFTFVWDEANRTLRETTKITYTDESIFGQFKNQLNLLESLRQKIEEISRVSFEDKTISFQTDIKTQLTNFDKLIKQAEHLKNKDIDLFDESDLVDIKNINDGLDEIFKKIKKMSTDPRYNLDNNSGRVIKQGLGFDDALKEVKQSVEAQGKLVKDIQFTEPINGAAKFTAVIKTQTGEVRKLKYAWDQTSQSLRQSTEVLKSGSTGLSSFTNAIKDGFVRFGKYFTGDRIISSTIRAFRTGITEIRELDNAFTEMQKVSDATTLALKEFSEESFNIGKSIGATGLAIQQSSADWMRLGYSLQEAGNLAKNTALYSNVGDMDIDTATEHLISSVKAFKDEFNSEVEASGAIVDKFNEIGNNFAISSADIGSSFERSAAALVAGGNNIDEALGLTTAGNLIIQDAETVGNALKVVALRVRGKPYFCAHYRVICRPLSHYKIVA